MVTGEGYAGNIEVKKTEKKGFLRTAKGKIAATGLAATIGLTGLGILTSQKTGENNPSPTQPGGLIIPGNSPEVTIIPSPSPYETAKPSLSSTEIPLPSWVKEIPPAKWLINEVPINAVTKKLGRFVEYPTPDGSGYVLSSQNATIVAVEPDIKNNSIWVAVTQNGDKLTESTSVININGKDTEYYQFKGLTVWYKIDNNTQILKKNPAGSQADTSFIGAGLEKIAGQLKVGNILYGIVSDLTNSPIDEINIKTLAEIKSSVGKQNTRDEKTFEIYAQTVALP